mmetsp:Transcript_54699/g.119349  ORF Transcript_54699/g.119349 Transcript_54699/m.119349 type:complete len:238 (+) Transcript_54699:771-1484(+)
MILDFSSSPTILKPGGHSATAASRAASASACACHSALRRKRYAGTRPISCVGADVGGAAGGVARRPLVGCACPRDRRSADVPRPRPPAPPRPAPAAPVAPFAPLAPPLPPPQPAPAPAPAGPGPAPPSSPPPPLSPSPSSVGIIGIVARRLLPIPEPCLLPMPRPRPAEPLGRVFGGCAGSSTCPSESPSFICASIALASFCARMRSSRESIAKVGGWEMHRETTLGSIGCSSAARC